MGRPSKYTPEFRSRAIEEVLERNRSVTEVMFEILRRTARGESGGSSIWHPKLLTVRRGSGCYPGDSVATMEATGDGANASMNARTDARVPVSSIRLAE